VVIGRNVRNATRSQAADAVFGVTAATISATATGSEAPEKTSSGGVRKAVIRLAAGSVIVTGLDYSNLALTTR